MTSQSTVVISIIVGTAPATGFESAARSWILARLSRTVGVRAELLELRDFPLQPWRCQPSEDEVVKRWRAAIARSDGFIFHIAPEHDGNAPATLLNAFEWGYPAWKDRVAAFLSGSDQMSWRAVQQMRAKATAVRMTATRSDLCVPAAILAVRDNQAEETIEEFLWRTQRLKGLREERQLARDRHHDLCCS